MAKSFALVVILLWALVILVVVFAAPSDLGTHLWDDEPPPPPPPSPFNNTQP